MFSYRSSLLFKIQTFLRLLTKFCKQKIELAALSDVETMYAFHPKGRTFLLLVYSLLWDKNISPTLVGRSKVKIEEN